MEAAGVEIGGLAVWAFDELDSLREKAAVTVTRFCEITGIPRATWYRWRSASSAAKGPWPTPAQDAVEAGRQDPGGRLGGLGAPQTGRPQAGRHRPGRLGPGVGLDDVPGAGPQRARTAGELHRRRPPGSRHAQGGVRLAADAPEPAVAGRHLASSRPTVPVPGTWAARWTTGPKPASPARSPSPRPPRMPPGSSMPPWPRSRTSSPSPGPKDLTDPDTGEIGALKLVTDNGPCFKSARFAAWVASKRHITHVRTRRRAPWDQRGDRAVLRGHQIRAPLPPRYRRRHLARSRSRLLPDDLQRHPPPRGHRHGPAPRPLPPDPHHPTKTKTKPSQILDTGQHRKTPREPCRHWGQSSTAIENMQMPGAGTSTQWDEGRITRWSTAGDRNP